MKRAEEAGKEAIRRVHSKILPFVDEYREQRGQGSNTQPSQQENYSGGYSTPSLQLDREPGWYPASPAPTQPLGNPGWFHGSASQASQGGYPPPPVYYSVNSAPSTFASEPIGYSRGYHRSESTPASMISNLLDNSGSSRLESQAGYPSPLAAHSSGYSGYPVSNTPVVPPGYPNFTMASQSGVYPEGYRGHSMPASQLSAHLLESSGSTRLESQTGGYPENLGFVLPGSQSTGYPAGYPDLSQEASALSGFTGYPGSGNFSNSKASLGPLSSHENVGKSDSSDLENYMDKQPDNDSTGAKPTLSVLDAKNQDHEEKLEQSPLNHNHVMQNDLSTTKTDEVATPFTSVSNPSVEGIDESLQTLSKEAKNSVSDNISKKDAEEVTAMKQDDDNTSNLNIEDEPAIELAANIQELEMKEGFSPDYYQTEGISLSGSGNNLVTKIQRKPESEVNFPEFVARKVVTVKSNGNELREYMLLAKCKHKNILKLYHWEINKVLGSYDLLYLYTELCDFNLKTLMKERTLNVEEMKNLCRQMIDGLCYLETEKVFHRDIKPENILVNLGPDQPLSDAVVKIADFDLSRLVPSEITSTLDLTAAGTKAYASPELCKAMLENTRFKTKHPFATDIFSLGAVIFEMFTKELPCKISELCLTSFQVDQLVRDKIHENEDICDALIQMLQWDPQRRPSALDLCCYFS